MWFSGISLISEYHCTRDLRGDHSCHCQVTIFASAPWRTAHADPQIRPAYQNTLFHCSRDSSQKFPGALKILKRGVSSKIQCQKKCGFRRHIQHRTEGRKAEGGKTQGETWEEVSFLDGMNCYYYSCENSLKGVKILGCLCVCGRDIMYELLFKEKGKQLLS